MHGMNRVAVEDPVTGRADLQAAAARRCGARPQADAAGAGGQGGRRDAAERQRRGGDADRR